IQARTLQASTNRLPWPGGFRFAVKGDFVEMRGRRKYAASFCDWNVFQRYYPGNFARRLRVSQYRSES
ncbi:MAG: hypothetical protein WBQ45_17155, partial [Roseiarcus sp.]